jgi:hypothetical protein
MIMLLMLLFIKISDIFIETPLLMPTMFTILAGEGLVGKHVSSLIDLGHHNE